MTQNGRIVGTVEFRPGDGATMPIPPGPVEVEIGDADATLSWSEGDAPGSAAMPLAEFRRYVAEGAIRLPN
jgi:hypothetical protein